MTQMSKRVLTWTEVLDARRRYESTQEYTTVRGLAEEFGISKSSMHRLLTYKTYKEPIEEA